MVLGEGCFSSPKRYAIVSKALKGREGDQEKDFPGGGYPVCKSVEEGKCRVCLRNSPGTMNG